ncbi:hypothetical protein ACO3TA_06180 [Methanocaldococcus sp. 28A]
MAENKYEEYVTFGLIGLILVIIGALISIINEKLIALVWTLIGSGIAIIWLSFHKVSHEKRREIEK